MQVNENDFLLFDNVIHVDAGDNNLPFGKLNSYSIFSLLFSVLIHVHVHAKIINMYLQ